MKFFEFPDEDIKFFSNSGNLEGKQISLDTLERAGVFVVRGLLSQDGARKYLKAYESGLLDGSARPRQNHLTEVSFDLTSPLTEVLFEPELKVIYSRVFQDGAGLHNIRIVRKDANNIEPVFTHQDSPYCLGFFDRYSLFLALTDCGPSNGGLFVYPGTHHLGYLGDAGAIHPDLTRQLHKYEPQLYPGDCLLMHSAIWHGSPRQEENAPRIMYDIQIQPIRDPSSMISLGDRPLPEWRLRLDNKEIFSNSRVQRGASTQK